MKLSNALLYVLSRLILVALFFLVLKVYSKSSKSLEQSRQSIPQAESRLVVLKKSKYNPEFVTVIVGQRIEFRNDDTIAHTVTSGVYGKGPYGREFNSNWIMPGKSWSFTPTKPGRYEYFCIPHATMGMKGIVMVIE